jgi:predicted phosphodiesterase
MKDKTYLAIPDAHFPWVCEKSLKKIIQLADELKPNFIISLGDLFDQFSFSRFPRSHNAVTPKEEMLDARDMTELMWARLRKAAPRAKCFLLKGNHDERLHKKILAQAPEFESLILESINGLYSFKGVETQDSERDELILNNILFMHGFRSKLGDHARHNGMSTVCGHSHKPGVAYMRLGDKSIFELNAGHIADDSAEQLSYTRQRRISHWSKSCGWIDDKGPRVILL